jgi:acetyl esterase/lipase
MLCSIIVAGEVCGYPFNRKTRQTTDHKNLLVWALHAIIDCYDIPEFRSILTITIVVPMKRYLVLVLLVFFHNVNGQQAAAQPDTAKQAYLSQLKLIGRSFSNEFYPNYALIYSLPENIFIAKIDSARDQFNALLAGYRSRLDTIFVYQQQTEIKYYFDKLLIEYPLSHPIYSGETSDAAPVILERLQQNLADFNKPSLLRNSDFIAYAKAFFSCQAEIELHNPAYRNTDNQQLSAVWNLIPRFISNRSCREYWMNEYLFDHIDNNGIKNIEPVYQDFKANCADTAYLRRINTAYAEDLAGKKDHLVKTYKTAGPYRLDMHIFLPDSLQRGDKRPTIVFFHGGSWSEGKPDWFFESCKAYAKRGWVACAVEYRTYGRQRTLPFSAVMDARSAIRWLRKQAREYHIDTGRIVASGNSAGGHLVLCTALADQWNEKTDDLKYSPSPNVLMVNAGVYDLTDRITAWIRKDLKDKELVKQISPVFLVRKELPPALIFHGTNDQNVPFASAEKFVSEMIQTGNNRVEFHPLQGANHFIWFDRKYMPEMTKFRTDFLSRLGY